MALPLIPILIGAAAVGSGIFGVAKGGKAISDNNKANDVNERAKRLQEELKKRLEEAKGKTTRSLERLGTKKLQVFQVPMAKFAELFQKVKDIELAESVGLNELSKFKIDRQSVCKMREISLLAESFLKGTAGGTIAGGAVAFGAYSAAGYLATASTGAAISGLSGVAATNATLAFFGGGSLAAGGLGIAGGTCVLGGIIAGPALAIVGSVMGAKASANLDRAYSNLSKVREMESEVNLLVTSCNGISRRADLFMQCLTTLEALFYPLLNNFAKVIDSEGGDYKAYSADAKNTVGAVLSTAKAIKALLDTPLLDDKGALTSDSETTLSSVNAFIRGGASSGVTSNSNAFVCSPYPTRKSGFPQQEVD